MFAFLKFFLLLLLLFPYLGQANDEQGLAVSQEAERRDTGWKSSERVVTMTLIDRQSRKSERHMRVRSMEVDGDGDKSLVIFNQPKDVQGTAVLTWTHISEPDDQWIFLPALKRVKRIASSGKSRPFMGSEFSYEDLASQEVEKYKHTLLSTEPCGNLNCFVVERVPNFKDSGYSKQQVWIDDQHYRTQKIVYFDQQGERLKTLNLEGYHQYQEQFWRADRLVMENHQNRKITIMDRSDFQFDIGLQERDFNTNALKRVR